MFCMEPAAESDAERWLFLDRHISEEELRLKIRCRRCYFLQNDKTQVGIFRYGMFWDSIPFLNLIYLEESSRGKGFGTQAMRRWEEKMREQRFPAVMTSTQSDESAQNFYRKLGYRDAGCLVLDVPALRQPLEIFLVKEL